MEELYLISVLGKLFAICAVMAFVLLVASLVMLNNPREYSKRTRGSVFVAMLVCFAGIILIPSQEELCIIYGVGSVIDYVQDNDQAKALPDNAVKAINKYLETLNEQEK